MGTFYVFLITQRYIILLESQYSIIFRGSRFQNCSS